MLVATFSEDKEHLQAHKNQFMSAFVDELKVDPLVQFLGLDHDDELLEALHASAHLVISHDCFVPF